MKRFVLRRVLVLVAGLVLAGNPARAESRLLAGEITNITHGATAPLDLRIEISEAALTGELGTQAPLTAGSWPLQGHRRGRWWTFFIVQADGTRTVFRGVLDGEGTLRGTFVFEGPGIVAQQGHFVARPRIDLPAPAR